MIDGRVDEVVWGTATVATSFTQQRPDPGRPESSRFRTEARLLYDDRAVYVAFRLFDPAPDSIAATLARRDFTGFSDFAHVVIDSYHDRRTAFRFAVNPAGVKKDVFTFDDGNEDIGWDPVWDAAAAIDSLGWTAEMRIPLSQLRYASGDAGPRTWGINFLRDVARTNERTWWAPILPDQGGFVSRFGTLEGLENLPSLRRIEVLPYTVGRLTRAPPPGDPSDPFYSRSDWYGSGGADFKMGVTSDLTLTGTVNPDFGQVEADASVVNLTAFETFFPERRPFFVEGSNIFRFNVGYPYFIRGTHFRNDAPLYSRRVGRAPQAGLPGDAAYGERSEAANILTAVKLTGRTAGGWSIGLLDAVTGRETSDYEDTLGVRRAATVEPRANYAVARIARDFRRGQSSIGGIFTATHRDLNEPRFDFLRSSAYTAGLDGRHRFMGGNASFNASILGSMIRGDRAAIRRVQLGPGHYYQRPDADHLTYDSTRTSLGGFMARAEVEKFGGGRWRGGLYGHVRTPGLELNDLGFSRTTDWVLQGAWVGYHVNQPARFYREWNINLNNWAGWSLGGERTALGFNTNGFLRFNNFWGTFFGIDHELPAWSTTDLRGGPALWKPTWTNFQIGVFSDSRKRISFEIFTSTQREYQSGSRNVDLFPFVAVRPSSRTELSLGPGISWNKDRTQFVATTSAAGTAHYVFGRIRQMTTSLTLRFNYTFTPDLSLQLYAQPFLSAGRYDQFKEVADPRATAFDTRFRSYTGTELTFDSASGSYRVDLNGDAVTDFTFDRPDFNIGEMRSNVVLRWEYRPGSTVFVVWSSGRSSFSPNGSFRFGDDSRRLLDAEGTNVFLVKMSYWMSP